MKNAPYPLLAIDYNDSIKTATRAYLSRRSLAASTTGYKSFPTSNASEEHWYVNPKESSVIESYDLDKKEALWPYSANWLTLE